MGTARAQGANKALTGKQRVWLLAGLLLLLLVAMAGYLSVATFDGKGLAGAARAAIEKARSVAELISQRSPGLRIDSELVKLKHRAARPHERALPKVVLNRPVPVFEHPPLLIDIVAAPPLTVPPGLDKSPLPIFEAPPTGWGPPIILPPGEGPPFGPPIVPPPGPPTPPPRVPEPSTWMTMLLGFGLLGCLFRRDRARARAR